MEGYHRSRSDKVVREVKDFHRTPISAIYMSMDPISLATFGSSVLQHAQASFERSGALADFELSQAEGYDRDVPKSISISAGSFRPGGHGM